MLKRLFASVAAIALAAHPAFALSGVNAINQQNRAPAANPDGFTPQQILNLPPVALGAGATVGGKLIAAHTANASTLAALANYATPVMRDDVGVLYADTGANCVNADGGSQIQSAAGHCWLAAIKGQRMTPFVFGAFGNGTGAAGQGNDDTSAIQRLFNWSVATGATADMASLPAGSMYRTTSPLTVTGHISITGSRCAPYVTGGQFSPGGGSTFWFDHAGQGIVFGAGASGPAEGMFMSDVCTYRQQPAAPSSGTWTPNGFDYDLVEVQDDLTLRDVMLINPTKGVQQLGGRLEIHGMKGQPAKVGIDVERALDTPNITDVHFWPFGANNDAINTYVENNLDALLLGRADNPFISGFGSIISNHCIHIKSTAPSSSGGADGGTVNKMHAVNLDCDIFGASGFYVDSTAVNATFQITNLTGQGANAVAPASVTTAQNLVDIEASNVHGKFANVRGTLLASYPFNIAGSGNKISFSGVMVDLYNLGGSVNGIFNVAANNQVDVNGQIDFSGGLANPQFSAGTGFFWASPFPYSAGVANQTYFFPYQTGGGSMLISDANGSTTLAVLSGGAVSLVGPAQTEFVALAGQSDVSAASNTPAGQVGIYYSTTNSRYMIYNNTGSGLILSISQNVTRTVP